MFTGLVLAKISSYKVMLTHDLVNRAQKGLVTAEICWFVKGNIKTVFYEKRESIIYDKSQFENSNLRE